MEVNVILFGRLQDIIGSDSLTIQDVADTQSLVARLQDQFPALRNSSFIVAVGKEIIQQNTALHTSATVALMPPFSGG